MSEMWSEPAGRTAKTLQAKIYDHLGISSKNLGLIWIDRTYAILITNSDSIYFSNIQIKK